MTPLLTGLLSGALVLLAAATLGAAVDAGRRSGVRGRVAASVVVPVEAPAPRGPAPPPWLVPRLAASFPEIEPTAAWRCWWRLAAGGVAGAALVAGAGLAVVVGAVAVLVPLALLAVARGRADRLLEEALPESLEAVARSLRSGASLQLAVEEAATATSGPLGRDLRAVAVGGGQGDGLGAALDEWAERRPLAGVRLAVAALGLGLETGGAQARAVDGVAATIRSRQAVAGEVRALSSQARLSGLVIAVAPLAFAGLATATDESTASFLLRTPLGLACLTVGLALDGLAALWMHRLAKVDP